MATSLRPERPRKPDQSSPTGRMVAEFLASREGRSKSTVATYRSPLETLFVPFCDREGVSSDQERYDALMRLLGSEYHVVPR